MITQMLNWQFGHGVRNSCRVFVDIWVASWNWTMERDWDVGPIILQHKRQDQTFVKFSRRLPLLRLPPMNIQNNNSE